MDQKSFLSESFLKAIREGDFCLAEKTFKECTRFNANTKKFCVYLIRRQIYLKLLSVDTPTKALAYLYKHILPLGGNSPLLEMFANTSDTINPAFFEFFSQKIYPSEQKISLDTKPSARSLLGETFPPAKKTHFLFSSSASVPADHLLGENLTFCKDFEKEFPTRFYALCYLALYPADSELDSLFDVDFFVESFCIATGLKVRRNGNFNNAMIQSTKLKSQCLWISTKKSHEVWHASFSHRGDRFCISTRDGSITVYSSDFAVSEHGGVALKRPPAPISSVKESREITQVLWSPDDQFILCVGRESYFLLKNKAGNFCVEMKTSYSYDNTGAWFPDSSAFLVGCTRGLSVVHIKKPLQTQTLLDHKFVIDIAICWGAESFWVAAQKKEENALKSSNNPPKKQKLDDDFLTKKRKVYGSNQYKNVKIYFCDSEGSLYVAFPPFHKFYLIASFGPEISALTCPDAETLLINVGEEIQRWDVSGITPDLLAERHTFRKHPGGRILRKPERVDFLPKEGVLEREVIFRSPEGFGGKIADASQSIKPGPLKLSSKIASFVPFIPLSPESKGGGGLCSFETGAKLLGRYYGSTMKRFRLRGCVKGNAVLCGSEDSCIYVWRDCETPEIALEGHSGPVNSVCGSNLCRRVFISASDDCTVRMWVVWAVSMY